MSSRVVSVDRQALRSRRALRRRARLQPWLYVLPAIVLVCLVIVWPLASNIVGSLQVDKRILAGGHAGWVGLSNYEAAWNEGLLALSMRNSVIFTGSTVVVSFVLGFVVALLLNSIRRGAAAYRIIIVLPWVIAPVVAAITWRWLFDDTFGFVNYILTGLGIIRQNVVWLGEPALAFIPVIMASIWRFFPFCTIMILAGLQAVSRDLLEAAEIDGAGRWQKFAHVTVPQIRSVLVVVVLLSIIWNFNEFGIVQVMTQGGPLQSTMVLPVLIRNLAYLSLRLGTASALSVMLAVVLLAFSIVYLRVVEREAE